MRRFRDSRCPAAIALLWASVAAGAAAGEMGDQRPSPDLRDVIGVTHVSGRYHLTGGDFLNEGADQILRLGSRVIKLYLTVPSSGGNAAPKAYPFNSHWPPARTLAELAKTPYFRRVFAKPFSTIILTTYSAGRPDHYWRRGVTAEEAEDETRQFCDLARHLLTAYRGTGKTFVLQHWEGDWAIRGRFDPAIDPAPGAIQGMIDWLNARQRGVDQARQEVGQQGVRVFHAAEVNLVQQCLTGGRPGVTNRVLPQTQVDLVSYSAWDTQGDPKLFRRALDFIASCAPRPAAPGRRNVYVGEFGQPENERTPEQVRETIENVINVGLDWGCPYLVYWQVYCNEYSRGMPGRSSGPPSNEMMRGFWLLRPDGSRALAWHLLEARLTGR